MPLGLVIHQSSPHLLMVILEYWCLVSRWMAFQLSRLVMR